MIITKDFILLNSPKTTSTYARKVVKMVCSQKSSRIVSTFQKLGLGSTPYQELKLKNIQLPDRPKNQHGTYSQIPEKFLNKGIVSVIRNPYDKFISTYEYQYWLKQPPEQSTLSSLGIEDLNKITVDQFAQIQIVGANKRFPHLSSLKVGSQTIQFIFMYFETPGQIFERLSEDYFFQGGYKQDLPGITFIAQNGLSKELFDFLERLNNNKSKLDETRQTGKVNVNKKKPPLKSYQWSVDSLSYVETYERFLFFMLKELGFEFERPAIQNNTTTYKHFEE